MHMIFTEREKEWIDKRKFGWPIKEGCPEEIRKSIQKKKQVINDQEIGLIKGDSYGKR